MAVFNSLTFDGENSLDYGVYITGEAVYNAPERAVEMISIPGRNGAIALDQGRFENIEVTYPAGTFGDDQPEFASKIRAFRNALASRFNYVKLTDSYHPDEYRLGLYKSGLTTTPVQRSKAGEFPIVFNCKPQRFLTSGETEVDGNAWSNVQTGSGSVVTVNNSDGDIGFKTFVVDIEPIQSGSGTPSPSNVRPISGWNGATVSVSSDNLQTKSYPINWNYGNLLNGVSLQDGAISATGEETANAGSKRTDYVPVSGGPYVLKAVCSSGYVIRVHGYNSNKVWVSQLTAITTSGEDISEIITIPSGVSYVRFSYPTSATLKFYTSSNSGVDWKNDAGTVYKGTLDVLSGMLTVTHGCVDLGSLNWSYSSAYATPIFSTSTSTIGCKPNSADIISSAYVARSSFWAQAGNNGCIASGGSSLNVSNSNYTNEAAFKTAMSGITAVYPFVTPLTYQLTPEEIELLLGTNNLWADSGNITVQYGNSPVYNPTEFNAKPLIKVTGTGTAVVGNTAVAITGSAGQTIYIDCDSMEIFTLNGGAPQSAANLVSFSGNDFPKLKPGSNSVSLGTGITSVTIIPRWWII